jgi:hypothetical protein
LEKQISELNQWQSAGEGKNREGEVAKNKFNLLQFHSNSFYARKGKFGGILQVTLKAKQATKWPQYSVDEAKQKLPSQ